MHGRFDPGITPAGDGDFTDYGEFPAPGPGSFSRIRPILLLSADFTALETIDGKESVGPADDPPPGYSLSGCRPLLRPGGGLSLGGGWRLHRLSLHPSSGWRERRDGR